MSKTFSELFDPTKTLQDYKDQIGNALIALNGKIDITEGTPVGNIIQVVSMAIETIVELSLAVYNDNQPYTASVESLINKYGALFGIEYKNGTKTQQNITLNITGACNIYNDTTTTHTQFQVADENGNIYIPTADVVFTEEDIGEKIVAFEALNYGAVSSDVNTITNILIPTDGISSCNNPTTYSSLGSEFEDVESYRKRILKASRNYLTTGTQLAIEDDLRNNGCADAFIYKNFTDTEREGVPAGSVAVVVKTTETEEQKEIIAEIIANNMQSANLYGFGLVENPSSVPYSNITFNILNDVIHFKDVANGTLRVQIGENIIEEKKNLNFTCITQNDDYVGVLNVLQNAGFTSVDFTLTNLTSIVMTSNTQGVNGNITLLEPTSGTDLRRDEYLDYAHAVINKAEDDIYLTQEYSIVYPKYICLVKWNDAIMARAKMKFAYIGLITIAKAEELKENIVKSMVSKDMFSINSQITAMDTYEVIKEVCEDMNLSGYVNALQFIRYDDELQGGSWNEELNTKHIYEYFNITQYDIEITNIN